MTSALSLRVAARFQLSHEFPSEQALQDYLHEHPGADRKNHSVKKPEGHGHHEEKPKTSWKDMVKNLSGKAKSFLEKAPGQVKKFVQDEEHRAEVLIKSHKAIVTAPMKYAESAFEVAKHEVKEFKVAGEGIKSWMSGKGMSHEQHHAFKKVATHVAVATAAGALGAGFGAGALAIGKGVLGSFVTSTAKKIAVKAVTKHLEHLPTFEEIAHITHHGAEIISELMERLAAEEAKQMSEEEVFKALIAAAVAKELKDLDPETIRSALEDAEGV